MPVLECSRHTHPVSGITHNMSTNQLASIFSSGTLVRLLSIFLLNPDRSYYQQELVRKTRDSLRPVQLALAKLEDAGLITKRPEGKHVYYRAVPSHPVFADLRSLFEKSFALHEVVLDALEPLVGSIEYAFIFGSIASGQELAVSDVDLMIVGRVNRRQVAAALGDIESHLGREVNVTIYELARLAEAIATKDPFVAHVLASPTTWLVGDRDEFERLAC